jgi:type 1 fimbria pilin
MIKNSIKQKIAIAASMVLAVISAQAQNADGSVYISGQVNANTCTLNIADTGGINSPTNKGTRTVELGTYSPEANKSGQTVGTKQIITFTLAGASGSGSCVFGAGTSTNYWNLALDLQTTQVNSTTFQNKPYLTNWALNGSSIGVVLFGGDNADVLFTTLSVAGGINGTKLASTNKVATDSIKMGIQFMPVTAAAPTAGMFSATVPLLIVYN